jgi:hypothetical protein
MSITVDGAPVLATSSFYEWCAFHELAVDGRPVPATHVAKKLFLYHADHGSQDRYQASRDEAGNPWSSVITRGPDGLSYNGQPVAITNIKISERSRFRERRS